MKVQQARLLSDAHRESLISLRRLQRKRWSRWLRIWTQTIRLAPKGYRTIKTPELPVLRPGPHQGLARGRLQPFPRKELVPPIDSIFARPFLGKPYSLFLYGLKQDKLSHIPFVLKIFFPGPPDGGAPYQSTPTQCRIEKEMEGKVQSGPIHRNSWSTRQNIFIFQVAGEGRTKKGSL